MGLITESISYGPIKREAIFWVNDFNGKSLVGSHTDWVSNWVQGSNDNQCTFYCGFKQSPPGLSPDLLTQLEVM